MTRQVQLVGFDCGSTTTNLVAARGRLITTALGRTELADVEPTFHSELIFTPFAAQQIDILALQRQLDIWLAEAEIDVEQLFAGGAMITGLAAERANATAVVELIESRLAGAVVALADDPRLESWLAFMGNCLPLSKAHPDTLLVNVDIGGGTTNLAWGLNGQVLGTASLFVGARHLRFTPGTRRLVEISAQGAKLLELLSIRRSAGDTLSDDEIRRVCQAYTAIIVATIDNDAAMLDSPIGQLLTQAPGSAAVKKRQGVAITLSGGVGALAYQRLGGTLEPGVARFGDLGESLAEQLVDQASIRDRLLADRPVAAGRATVFGLVRHSAELSGSTLYLPRPERLPLANVPIVGRVDVLTTEAQLADLMQLVAQCHPAGCLQLDAPESNESLRKLAERLQAALHHNPLAPDRTLVLLVTPNVGKLLGNYVCRWGVEPLNLIVIDEVPLRDAQYLRLGRLREGVVPLWLHAIG